MSVLTSPTIKKVRKSHWICYSEANIICEFVSRLQPRLMACDLLDMVASQVGLHEKEYFGLSYQDDM